MQNEWEYGLLFEGQVKGILQCLYFMMPREIRAGSTCLTRTGRTNPLLIAIVPINI